MKDRLLWWLEWISTGLLIVGSALTAYDVIPANKWFSFAGNLGWMLVGYYWQKWSLVTISAILVVIYIVGVFH